MTRQRLPQPRHVQPVPGQMSLWARPVFTVLLPRGRSLTLLQGGRTDAPAPTTPPVVARKERAA